MIRFTILGFTIAVSRRSLRQKVTLAMLVREVEVLKTKWLKLDVRYGSFHEAGRELSEVLKREFYQRELDIFEAYEEARDER